MMTENDRKGTKMETSVTIGDEWLKVMQLKADECVKLLKEVAENECFRLDISEKNRRIYRLTGPHASIRRVEGHLRKKIEEKIISEKVESSKSSDGKDDFAPSSLSSLDEVKRKKERILKKEITTPASSQTYQVDKETVQLFQGASAAADDDEKDVSSQTYQVDKEKVGLFQGASAAAAVDDDDDNDKKDENENPKKEHPTNGESSFVVVDEQTEKRIQSGAIPALEVDEDVRRPTSPGSTLVEPVAHLSRKDLAELNNQQSPSIESIVSFESIFKFCNISSIDQHFQDQLCERLNLRFVGDEGSTNTSSPLSLMWSKSLQDTIFSQTQSSTNVQVFDIRADGNCLFRSLSLALTGSQSQHELMRSHVVNHMKDPRIYDDMKQLFMSCNSLSQNSSYKHSSYDDYLVAMEKSGEWGTDQEITAAAHLFGCSVLCLSKYGTTDDDKFCIQQFSPHFGSSPICNETCHHESIYIINKAGLHYDPATVSLIISDGSGRAG